ncbi:MAG: ClbS/DfsB family four-helix bundle protein [Synergistaceae bacterium]|jgi:hypothetical protein|nr:ClbS/DfsB family four-helix bundle protein [Synergistaceae bacterium]
MPRPETKTELLIAANTRFDKLFALIDAMPKSEQTAAFCFDVDKAGKEAHWKRDKNIRDVLVHLYEWHRLLLNWVAANRSGESKPFLPAPYNWKTYGDMNAGFWKKHQPTPHERSREMLKESHRAVVMLIDTFSDEELFEKKHFSWTGGTTLGSYCVSATSSHYDWAIKKIRAQIKALKEQSQWTSNSTEYLLRSRERK